MNPSLYFVTMNGIPLDSGYTRLDLARAQFVSIYRAMLMMSKRKEDIENWVGDYQFRVDSKNSNVSIMQNSKVVPINPADMWTWEDALPPLSARKESEG